MSTLDMNFSRKPNHAYCDTGFKNYKKKKKVPPGITCKMTLNITEIFGPKDLTCYILLYTT